MSVMDSIEEQYEIRLAAKDKEIAELRAILEMYEETQSKLSRLTTALNDDERVKRVAIRISTLDVQGFTFGNKETYRAAIKAITDYRTEILKELQQQNQDSGNYRTDPEGSSMSSKFFPE